MEHGRDHVETALIVALVSVTVGQAILIGITLQAILALL